MKYQPQVDVCHYHEGSYRVQDRWNSYWHQLQLVESTAPLSVLEVGVGEGVVARELRARGSTVTTVDIAENLKPDVVGSVTALPVGDNTFDVVLCAEVLEHIRFEDVAQALGEISRVSRKYAVISIPHPGYVFLLQLKFPLVKKLTLFSKLPFFWRKHRFNGEHYWELGERGFPVSRFLKEAHTAGLVLTRTCVYEDDPAHRFFLFEKKV
jgi:ubiquinone/menaquinone biosynthesis C-methylase UbiE